MGFCCIWIPHVSLMDNSLYEATKRGKRNPSSGKQTRKKLLKQIKQIGSCLRIDRYNQVFLVYVHRQKGMTIGFLTQLKANGILVRIVEYLSKQQHICHNSLCNPRMTSCFRALAATTLVQEAGKSTLGQDMAIKF